MFEVHPLIGEAYAQMHPDTDIDFTAQLKYSGRFKGYNANVRYRNKHYLFKLSKRFMQVSDEIKIGLIQYLFNRINKTDISTINTELYRIFLKKLQTIAPKTKTDPLLADSFGRMNEKYLDGMLIQPNLVFAGKNFRTLGTYEYQSDTIRISEVLKKDLHLLDYVMYHEMLHMKFGYKETKKRTVHHSREFRMWEARFEDKDIEKRLRRFLRKEKLKHALGF